MANLPLIDERTANARSAPRDAIALLLETDGTAALRRQEIRSQLLRLKRFPSTPRNKTKSTRPFPSSGFTRIKSGRSKPSTIAKHHTALSAFSLNLNLLCERTAQ
jgi:hypothetical protein